MGEQAISRADLEQLAGKLDALDLTEDERDLLAGVFAAAGQTFAGEDEVSGFGFPGGPPPPAIKGNKTMGAGFMNTFEPTYRVSVPGREKVFIFTEEPR